MARSADCPDGNVVSEFQRARSVFGVRSRAAVVAGAHDRPLARPLFLAIIVPALGYRICLRVGSLVCRCNSNVSRLPVDLNASMKDRTAIPRVEKNRSGTELMQSMIFIGHELIGYS